MWPVQALMQGDWRRAYNYLASLTSWNLVPAKDSLLAMLRSKLQEEVRLVLLFLLSPPVHCRCV